MQTWGTAHTPPAAEGLSARGFEDQTLRMIVRTSVGGTGLRLRLTNEHGEAGLHVGAASVALQASGASVQPGTCHWLTFGGSRSLAIPAGVDARSDPIEMRVPALASLVVSMYLPDATGPATWHPCAQQVNFVAAGEHAGDTSGHAYGHVTQSWFYLRGVDVQAPQPSGAVVAFGDSITDGASATVNANRRWPDHLARRLNAGVRPGNPEPGGGLGVVNAGIAGNRVLTDADMSGEDPTAHFGVRALARFGGDALGKAGVRTVILVEGINDIGNDAGFHSGEPLTAEALIAGMQSIVGQAHAEGLAILGGTLLPYAGADYYAERGERIRQEANHWVRTGGAFDGVVDFDRALRDPAHPERMRPSCDSGDHLHPSDIGYAAMAGAVDLSLLRR